MDPNPSFFKRGICLRLRTLLFCTVVLGLFLAATKPAAACSMCRCGDPTFNALGSNIYSSGQFHLALDWDRFNKTQFTSESGVPGTDHEIENRVTLTLSYSIAERLVLVARAPYSFRNLTTTTSADSSTVTTHGVSDPEIYALVRLWSSTSGLGFGRRTWISAIAGVKTAWGQNAVRQNGERVDEHAQPGTGSTDVFGGLSGVYLFDERSSVFASAQYRGTGRNSFGYKYGNLTMANLAYERKLADSFDAVVEANLRHSGSDQVDSSEELDPNTGGNILYVTPRLIVNLGGGIVLRLAAQIPVWKSLYGVQSEKVNLNAGLTFLF
jgi:hypothetical protein